MSSNRLEKDLGHNTDVEQLKELELLSLEKKRSYSL